ncbi:helix-turn-helix domain-containing protein [Kitasatospora sp. NPDC059973]|uniref:helix-turn-helix domain-containing protein n=1 Tax=Kitasatospora sp. NPDC059973 TaxID=3347020 RepID=UPI0036CF62FA
MERIAEAAPVSKRTLYAHFRTKSDLVIAYLRALAGPGNTLESVLTREASIPGSGSFDCSTHPPRRRPRFGDARSSVPRRSSPTP